MTVSFPKLTGFGILIVTFMVMTLLFIGFVEQAVLGVTIQKMLSPSAKF